MSSLDHWFEFDCGCKTKVHGDGSGAEIEYCDIHYAAFEMFDALKSAMVVISQHYPEDVVCCDKRIAKINTVLKKANKYNR